MDEAVELSLEEPQAPETSFTQRTDRFLLDKNSKFSVEPVPQIADTQQAQETMRQAILSAVTTIK